MAIYGLAPSYNHPENGMTLSDMNACVQAANQLNEVIIFRSTGPWAKRWIERGYPTKNFHVKGKSSDWGPQAGFVPYLGEYSKVGGDPKKAQAGTEANDHGLHDSYTKKVQLCLTEHEIRIQLTTPTGRNGVTAITQMAPVEGSRDYFLHARRSSDQKPFVFRAIWVPFNAHFKIAVFDRVMGHQYEIPTPLEVMTSSEAGANNKPLTGDYDLMAVCPAWGNYGSRSVRPISKDGIDFGKPTGAEPGQTFAAGTNMDAVLDMRTNTGLPGSKTAEGKPKTFGKNGFTAGGYGKAVAANPDKRAEHNDMGNLTPRILNCINVLNEKMGGNNAFRRVHHNAESHRNAIFGGITAKDMREGDAFPLTVFQPDALTKDSSPTAEYTSVSTLLDMNDFATYIKKLHAAGYYVPRSWAWQLSIRDDIKRLDAEADAAHVPNHLHARVHRMA